MVSLTSTAGDAKVVSFRWSRSLWSCPRRQGAVARWTRANLPTAEFATMPTHIGFVVDPEGFNATVRDFVAGAGTST